ncbi:hypothetical protein K443DRAFT_687284 [Laccaria amethystina LaAM-08-1]|uniref:Uncharacterized protein n=1 Tax=Laccaria amethystina LaAM-08-1 TaxID=1095629 RepID=A0A0C9WKG9_9AGAR|nr:hypothetical protein K443DRAFT_687284 [Laccaria amethystina LaAM-08-1]
MTNASDDPSPPVSGSAPATQPPTQVSDDFMRQYHELQMMMSQMLLARNINPQTPAKSGGAQSWVSVTTSDMPCDSVTQPIS